MSTIDGNMGLSLPAEVGARLMDVDTPILLLDLDAFERNLNALHATLAGLPVRVRPHAKAHKCPEIALRQMARGATGICCQKVSEAGAPSNSAPSKSAGPPPRLRASRSGSRWTCSRRKDWRQAL
jgi:hypothetical protein